jgi:flagellar motor switch protein FliN/FliY
MIHTNLETQAAAANSGYNEKIAKGPKNVQNIDLLMDVVLEISVELGRTQMTLKQVLELQKGSVIELDRLAGEVVDIFINGRAVAKGEVVVVDDKFGVRITELLANKREEKAN